MSLVLGIETATIEVSVAIAGDDGLLGSVAVRGTRLQVETVHPAVAELCRACGVQLGDLDAVAVDVGPGRFTGLRVGVAAAKTFAYALSVPVVTAFSTELLAMGAALDPGPVVPVVDMRRGEVAFVLPGGPAAPPELGRPEDLGRRLATLGGVPLLVGDGALRYREAITKAASAPLRFGGDGDAAPRAEVLARLGRERLGRHEVADPFAVLPLYLRAVDVRIGWETRDTPASPLEGAATSERR